MKKTSGVFCVLCAMMLLCTGCSTFGEKNTSVSVVYGITSLICVGLLVGCCYVLRAHRFWFITLFSCVLVVNVGYFALSVSATLQAALWANRLSYLGSVLLPLAMLAILLQTSGIHYKKWWLWCGGALALLVFLLAASPGVLPWYYRSVELATVNGVTVLVKEYGDWHIVYLFYLLFYFGVMVYIALRAMIAKKMKDPLYAVFLLCAVLVNILVWLLEQMVQIDFEVLSVSYIISQLFLLAVQWMMQQRGETPSVVPSNTVVQTVDLCFEKEQCDYFKEQLAHLTPTERMVLQHYVDGCTTKEVLALMNIKENTLKYHNRNIYSKLGVSSRKQLIGIYRQVQGE